MNALMNAASSFAAKMVFAAALLVVTLPSAQAHLMLGQRGTLNIVGSGAFMVLSVPVSAFDGVDDDGDGKLSMIEFNNHRDELTAAVVARARLIDGQGPRPLQGLMLAPSIPDDDPLGSAQHMVVMGRYALRDTTGLLQFDVDLFGKAEDEKNFSVTVTRKATNQQQTRIHTPEQAAHELFPSSWVIFADFVTLGALHIFEGPDHLLFLLVVLATGWSLRQVIAVLTTFTLGHALTLTLGVYGGFSMSAAVVEPAIAATIVGMALFDPLNRRIGNVPAAWIRLSLVFGCSLIHGLGLSSALQGMGLDSQNQLPSLAGFNVGIELAQVAIVSTAAALVLFVTRLFGRETVEVATRIASACALTIGATWFVLRVAAVA